MTNDVKTVVTYALALCFMSMLAASFSSTPIFIGVMTLVAFVSASLVMTLLFGSVAKAMGKDKDK